MRPAERAAALAHDVGKYIARVARNVPSEGPIPAPLLPLLAKDLYELPGNVRASARFAELTAHDEDGDDANALDEVRSALEEIDALEERVRAGEEAACREACRLALNVEARLRAHAKERG